jgi:hypothetical protein
MVCLVAAFSQPPSPALLTQSQAHSINDEYRKQLEQSGCTQMSELQGCDFHKSTAGFGDARTPAETSNKKAAPVTSKEGATPTVTK